MGSEMCIRDRYPCLFLYLLQKGCTIRHNAEHVKKSIKHRTVESVDVFGNQMLDKSCRCRAHIYPLDTHADTQRNAGHHAIHPTLYALSFNSAAFRARAPLSFGAGEFFFSFWLSLMALALATASARRSLR